MNDLSAIKRIQNILATLPPKSAARVLEFVQSSHYEAQAARVRAEEKAYFEKHKAAIGGVFVEADKN